MKQWLSNLRQTHTTVARQLRMLIICSIVPFAILTMLALYMLGLLNREYAVTLQNATTASEFNIDFKDKLDLDMYHYVAQSSSMDHLPMEEVERARSVLVRLQQSTTQSENRWRLRSMLNLTDRLQERMQDIAETKSYDERMQKLENDIYIITGLIGSYMHAYLYDEVYALASLQKQIDERSQMSMIGLVGGGIVIGALVVVLALRFSKDLTRPISDLHHKVTRIGRGDFAVLPVPTHNEELQALDKGFDHMVEQITLLLQQTREDEKALRRAELELLQAQINPHFLYNTFDSIIWLAEMQKYELVVQITTDLSHFFRYSLANGKDIITLEEECKQVQSYLHIQQVRYQDILQYEMDIPTQLYGYQIPKLTLQPLVENALYHGLKNKRGGGKITICARVVGQDIRLQVRDNGAGMQPQQFAALCAGVYENRHTGLGLANVHKRIRLYCGDSYGLAFESVPEGGTVVTVRIPKENQLPS